MRSSSEGHLYREQQRFFKMGWAGVGDEPTGCAVKSASSIYLSTGGW